jgi:metallo-beta-lactamase family protein
MTLQFCGATGEVTGSLYVIRTGSHTILLECGLIQGGADNEQRNWEAFPVDIAEIDAVILSHAHIDHSGRVPRLVRQGYQGPVFVHEATKALCEIMLPDSGYLNEKEAEWENRKRRHKRQSLIQPLYTREDGENCIKLFRSASYGETLEVFRGAPVMNPAETLTHADAVLMESTYGDRLHRPITDTLEEMTEVFQTARAAQGNILIPAFTVGRTQDLLHLMAENFERWNLDDWHIFLDSPMAIEATEIYSTFDHLYETQLSKPPNLHQTRTPEESMVINELESGAIIIAGSGMCSGGRILHHLKHNVWRPQCHLVVVGYQAHGTLGRRLVDGAETIKLWGDDYRVRIRIHTIGGLSAHADQQDLIDWYRAFDNRPSVYLVHGERRAQGPLVKRMQSELKAPVSIADRGQTIEI